MSAEERRGYARLLDAWVPPRESGDPVGCLATSFTFGPAFFEEECLARFLDLESDPQEDGPLYLIEREEKLASVACAAALVDVQHCRGRRSLRWDLLPVRVPNGVMHAKIALLCWQHRIRLLISSANLTEDGYRRNQEVFGCLDYYEGGGAPREALDDVVAFLREAATYADTGASPVVQRWNGLLSQAVERVTDWGSPRRGDRHARVAAVLVGPKRSSAMEQLGVLWPTRRPPTDAHVVSPFFDPPALNNAPADALWQFLRRKGEASVTYHVTAEEVPDSEQLLVHVPESLQQATPRGRTGVETRFARIREADFPSSEAIAFRPLHAKQLWLENDAWVASMVGSSNFTSPGLGIGRSANMEANLVYLASRAQSPKVVKVLAYSQLRGEEIDDARTWVWRPREDEARADEEGLPELPQAFGAAVLRSSSSGRPQIEFTFSGKPPAGWCVYPEDSLDVLYGEGTWRDQGTPAQVVLDWGEDLPPTGLEVTWQGAGSRAWWPINIADVHVLPPPSELRGLSLDALIHILTSARPLKEALRTWLARERKRQHLSREAAQDALDPHKRVDTSDFLIQRTRRISWALNGLRERLECPVPTEQALAWRIYGPVGVRQVAEALKRERRSPEEYAFLMAELLMEVMRVRPGEAPGCLSPKAVRQALGQFVGEMREEVATEAAAASPAVRNYIERVLGHLGTEVGAA